MPKSRIFFIVATITIMLIGCSQVEEGTFIQGNITEINETSGDMEIDIELWTTVSEEEDTSKESYGFIEKPMTQTIRVSNPEDYEEGQKVKVKVIKDYDEHAWDLDRLKFEVEEVS
ncbi:hypothetical protein NC661_13470 [Aquibacillus koreensis]|uniref:DUF3221 domain-containing protein n=1 Tax=Aquibacillus koreensis TaxID=279446 RepID=A0A9X3WM76_9BACI|nr:hypothetical protein [Aquibacillus koreensis]MCT2536268.1 hypothetical protein [Aquibacillus koreensis]MDC3421380.1 hypothetical protein [Aquibacillus koreensis]